MPRRHPCDLCGHDRRRWQRLCGVCFDALPHAIRMNVVNAWKRGDKAAWRAAKRAAIEHMGVAVAAHMAAYAKRIAALTGERHP